MTTIAPPVQRTLDRADEPSAPKRRSKWPAVALFVALTSAYFTVGAVLIIRYDFFESDALSRVANAGYTMMSRDPHMGAIGFVWNPLPSLVQIPLLPLSHWWPELRTYGLAGMLQSAAFMAGSAVLIRQIAIDRGVGSVWRWVAVCCFALNPMIIIYGGSGMSEAAMLFCLLWCVRHLLRWVELERVGDLGWAGIALGIGYLTRYEMIPAACGAAVLVGVVTFYRLPRQSRLSTALANMLIVLFPVGLAVAMWAITGWIVTGELFATVSSQYGNSSQVRTAVERGGIKQNANVMVIAERMFGMQPFVGIAVALAGAVAILKKRVDILVPIAILGAILVFAAWGHYTVSTFGWLRFYMPAIPMVIVLALVCWTPTAERVSRWRPDSISAWMGAALLTVSILVGTPVTARAMLDDDNTTNQPLLLGLNSMMNPHKYPPEVYRRMTAPDHILADYLDRKHLPPGSVLTDTFISSLVWLASDNPKQFLITSDYDFTAALNRPWDFGVRYILVSNPAGNAAKDAITERYPSMWADGAGLGRLAHVAGPTGEEWRLYRVEEPIKESEASDTKPASDASPNPGPPAEKPGG